MICFAFWFGEVRSLVVSYNLAMLILSGQYIPIRFFPENILNIMPFKQKKYILIGVTQFQTLKTIEK